ncbi:flagellar biosynthesis anti-sigma factor FlgM [Romboutsia sp. 1001216sp1]|uniref:flagellar biosynthesis anti-sigma factor FlgM n=1 Tax=Romboutsia TaxID=1501226 RepID=UPI000B860AA7|nr:MULTISPECIES: flagellar biosynthesis anti-sigma factor FlgM [Romboutsia]MDB8791155.1 flagellar biosynthesis anti-sigma factor FlgM [Romboutsia sp. 1001216sp1]MDB8792335.1 flagellar biosynthesis anti-sigma factor FlgM [Romboutsia sp. 1001216sp1]MDB8795630.1 flagellar biosynthesis anti-sigma factor FlgM [Romboutsia sp. 1001216sp1]MDB8798491.1 flagellar biosynthesis anti-sigma factor FlgM [Romboutsia sp. 1001216sp1]MDB8800795.1 flagellar biosynthesis anti-sigma factor FlgM [Romboutsia sp. 1001
MNINLVKFRNLERVYNNNKVDVSYVKNTKKGDTVEISQMGKYLNKVNSSKEEVNIDRVNEIKSKIESGQYRIDSNELAKKIIEKMRGEHN